MEKATTVMLCIIGGLLMLAGAMHFYNRTIGGESYPYLLVGDSLLAWRMTIVSNQMDERSVIKLKK